MKEIETLLKCHHCWYCVVLMVMGCNDFIHECSHPKYYVLLWLIGVSGLSCACCWNVIFSTKHTHMYVYTDFRSLSLLFLHISFAYACHILNSSILNVELERLMLMSMYTLRSIVNGVYSTLTLYVFINITHRKFPKSLISKIEIIAICVMGIPVKIDMFAEFGFLFSTHLYYNNNAKYTVCTNSLTKARNNNFCREKVWICCNCGIENFNPRTSHPATTNMYCVCAYLIQCTSNAHCDND